MIKVLIILTIPLIIFNGVIFLIVFNCFYIGEIYDTEIYK